jgi:cytoskeletal protein CcmA (bactofilin family)
MPNKNRADLKSYFVKNAIPTEGNFADLVDSQLNQTDDGVFKAPGEPLAVVAASGDQKRALRLYGNYPANPDWFISLNPAQDPANPASSRPGFGVADGAGRTRLFIDTATGRVGIGTNNPQQQLDVAGSLKVDGAITANSATIAGSVSVGAALSANSAAIAGSATVGGALTANSATVSGPASVGGALAANSATIQGLARVNGRLQVAGDRIVNHSGWGIVQTNATDWLRINPDETYPAIALYKPVALGSGGLSVGEWAQLPTGQLRVTGLIQAGASATVYGGWLEAIRFTRSEHSAITHSGGGLLFGMHSNRNFYFIDTAGGRDIMSISAAAATVDLPSGRLNAPHGVRGGEIGIGTQIHGAVPYPYETIQMHPGHNLRVYFGQKQRFILENTGQFTMVFDQGIWVFQNDGNLVKYNNAGAAIWALNRQNGSVGW